MNYCLLLSKILPAFQGRQAHNENYSRNQKKKYSTLTTDVKYKLAMETFRLKMSLQAMSLGSTFCMSRKSGMREVGTFIQR